MRLLIYGDIGGSGGYARYCKGLLGSKAIPGDVEVWFVTSSEFNDKLQPLDKQVNIITHRWIISKSRILRYMWHLWVYPQIVKKIKPNAEFYPSGNLRVYFRKACTITTCHNLLLFDKKELEKISDRNEKAYFLRSRRSQTNSFKKSDATIFLSKNSQELVCAEVPSIKQSTIIGHGLDKAFIVAAKRSYKFESKIKLLYISPYYHYKHQIEVVKSVEILRDLTGRDLELILIGGGNSSYATELKKYVTDKSLHHFTTIKDNLNYEELLKEYIAADIFIFASSCETFGITILEAMGARLPIACSNRTGLPEILKDAGLYFDPEDPNSIAEQVGKLISNEDLRRSLGEKASRYAQDFTWAGCAEQTFKYIKTIAVIENRKVFN